MGECSQKPPAVMGAVRPAAGQWRQVFPAHPRHLREQIGQRLDQQTVDRLAVRADAFERYALHIAVDGRTLAPGQAARDMGQYARDPVEELRLVRPGPDHHRQCLGPPDPDGHVRARLLAEKPGHALRQRSNVVGVVMTPARRPVQQRRMDELVIRVVAGEVPGQGTRDRRYAHWPLLCERVRYPGTTWVSQIAVARRTLQRALRTELLVILIPANE